MNSVFQFAANISFEIGDCREVITRLVKEGRQVDAIATDPPYEINYMAKEWDNSGIATETATWNTISRILKPGGFLAAFSAARTYHHMASAIEAAGFGTYPCLIWAYPSGMPKPQNVSKLFDRDVCGVRMPIGYRPAAGYNSLQIKHGQQQYTNLDFALYESDVSPEAQAWTGYYYGVNALKPGFDMIYLGRKPISEPRVIDNIRIHGTGALNIKALRERGDGSWPSNVLRHGKARATEHGCDHPTVKPTALMEDLISLICPSQGVVLDPFAGSGTTGLACGNLGMHCYMIDNDHAMDAMIRQRLSAYL